MLLFQRELCRKDDCESWLYMLVEITVGKLPWRNMKVGSFLSWFVPNHSWV